MNYREPGQIRLDGVTCNLCGLPPKKPYGILGWVFDKNFAFCLECRKQGHDTPKDLEPDPTPNIGSNLGGSKKI